MEEWRVIEEFPSYKVSNFGRIKSLSKIMNPSLTNQGYFHVGLYKEGKQFFRKVHRLVCEAFNGPPPFPEAQALHEDDDKSNNADDNLFWGTTKQNADDRNRNGKSNTASGERHGFAKLDWEKVRLIRKLRLEGISISKLAIQFQVSNATIVNVSKYKVWKE